MIRKLEPILFQVYFNFFFWLNFSVSILIFYFFNYFFKSLKSLRNSGGRNFIETEPTNV